MPKNFLKTNDKHQTTDPGGSEKPNKINIFKIHT